MPNNQTPPTPEQPAKDERILKIARRLATCNDHELMGIHEFIISMLYYKAPVFDEIEDPELLKELAEAWRELPDKYKTK